MGQQDREEQEEVLGKYLSEWVEDLRSGREPQISEQTLQDLTDSQVDELLAMARFTKAMHFPTESWEGRTAEASSLLGHRIFDMKQNQLANGRSLILSSSNFGECLHEARSSLGLSLDDLSDDMGIPKQLLVDVEVGRRSPIRIQPVQKMMSLILRLSIAFRETVDLIRTSAEKWTFENFQASPTQLGRISGELSPGERQRLLEGSGSKDLESDIEQELKRINQYTGALHQQVERQASKF